MKPLLNQLPYDKFSIIKLYSKLHYSLFIQLILLISLTTVTYAQNADNDTISIVKDSTILADSIRRADSISRINSIVSKDAVKSRVEYKAKDSTRFDLSKSKIYLYKDAEVYYENISLKAAYIELNLDSNLVYARGVEDSNGVLTGSPVFKDGDQEFNSKEMTYNFKTKKGKINEVITQEGQGYLHGKDVKKTQNDVIYIRNGMYTTCSLDHPHFSIASRKLKVIPGKKIVTGPAVLVIEDVPTVLGIPFGIFPNSNDRSSGILVPAPGESATQGFFLQNGGYYFGISDKMDLAIRGDIYSKGSYAFNATTNYRNRYRYNGTASINRSITKRGVIREDPNYSESRDFFVRWNHNQDPKARPNSRFSANVNAGTNTNFSNNLNTTTSDYLNNTFNSNINYSKSFAGKPFTLALAARHSQNSQTGIVSLTAPDASFNLQRVFLPGPEFVKKIGVSATLNAKNEINTPDTTISINNLPELADKFKYGVRNSVNLGASYRAFKYFSFNPSFNSSQILYFNKINRFYSETDSAIIDEKINENSVIANYNYGANLSTILYGLFQFKNGKVEAIRHKMTPSIGYNVTPENNTGRSTYIDQNGKLQEYSVYDGSIFGSVTTREAQNITMSLQNNLEMKVRTETDTGMTSKKIKILENLSFSTQYNVVADSLNWAPVRIDGRTYLGKNTSLYFGGSLSLYELDTNGREINSFQYNKSGSLGRLENAFVALQLNLRSPQGGKKDSPNSPANIYDPYIDFDVPWSLGINYKFNYDKPAFEENINQALNFTGDISLTDKWKVGLTSGYDFDAKDLTYTTINIYRDLHCWEMTFNWIPIGVRQSYFFTIKVKATVLQDLKLEKRSLPQPPL